MLFEVIGSLGYDWAVFFSSLIPQIPDLPQSLHDSLFTYLDLIFDSGSNLISLFIRIDTIKIVVPALILIINADKIYQVMMWIVRKIPLLSMK